MAEDRQREWQELLRAAQEKLDRHERIEPLPARKVVPVLRLWGYPSFASWYDDAVLLFGKANGDQ